MLCRVVVESIIQVLTRTRTHMHTPHTFTLWTEEQITIPFCNSALLFTGVGSGLFLLCEDFNAQALIPLFNFQVPPQQNPAPVFSLLSWFSVGALPSLLLLLCWWLGHQRDLCGPSRLPLAWSSFPAWLCPLPAAPLDVLRGGHSCSSPVFTCRIPLGGARMLPVVALGLRRGHL